MAQSIGEVAVGVTLFTAISAAEGALGTWAVTTVSAATGCVIGAVAEVAHIAITILYNGQIATKQSEEIDINQWQLLLFKTVVVLASIAYCGITAPFTVTAIAVSTVALPALTIYAISD